MIKINAGVGFFATACCLTEAFVCNAQLTGASGSLAGREPPNILVILTDDVGWGDLQCYNSDGRIPTPNADRLAREGMRFTRAHTPAALCAPTRYSMVTGNYPFRSRVAGGVWGFNDPSAVLPGQLTLAQMLKPAGYRAAMFGKAGFGGSFNSRLPSGKSADVLAEDLAPFKLGFDYSYLIPRGHQSWPFGFYENGTAVSQMSRTDGAITAADWDTQIIGERLVSKATAFLDDHLAKNTAAGKSSPFYIHFCTDGAHSPYTPPRSLLGAPVKGVTGISEHTDMVYETDVITGKLLEALEQRNLLKNTLIVYTSDNGGMPFERENGHDAVGGLRGRKASIFEAGHRVPFIVRWGDGTPQGSVIPPGSVRNQIVGTHDIVATALEAASLQVPGDQCLDSISLLPVLMGRRDDSRPVRQALMIQSRPGGDYYEDMGFPNAGVITPSKEDKARREAPFVPVEGRSSRNMSHALLTGNWKLVTDIENDRPAALYDLDADPMEQTTRIGDPEQAARIQQMYLLYQEIRDSQRSVPSGR